jgi:hypothetical protein
MKPFEQFPAELGQQIRYILTGFCGYGAFAGSQGPLHSDHRQTGRLV